MLGLHVGTFARKELPSQVLTPNIFNSRQMSTERCMLQVIQGTSGDVVHVVHVVSKFHVRD